MKSSKQTEKFFDESQISGRPDSPTFRTTTTFNKKTQKEASKLVDLRYKMCKES